MTSYVFITGGVVSSLGKGITSACLGAILEARGLTISMIKLDPYINVDPGTMSPFQHGEVFVTHDGTETDLDLGIHHHEGSVKGVDIAHRGSRGVIVASPATGIGGGGGAAAGCQPQDEDGKKEGEQETA